MPLNGHRRVATALVLRHLPRDQPYTKLEALLSLDWDQSRGITHSLREYARIWRRSTGWTKDVLVTYAEHQSDLATGGYGEARDTSETVVERPPDTTGEREQEQESLPMAEPPPSTAPAARAAKRCPGLSPMELAECRDWMLEHRPDLEPDFVVIYEAFMSHTFRTPKTDWRATFKNWLRNTDTPKGPATGGGGSPFRQVERVRDAVSRAAERKR